MSKSVKAAVKEYEREIAKGFKSDPKRIHDYVKHKQQVTDIVNSLEDENGLVTTNQNTITRILNDYFQSVFVLEHIYDVIPELNIRTQSKCDIDESYISEIDVKSRLAGLDESKSLGLYGINPRIF